MAKKYFSDLNYTLANEDTQVERKLVETIKPKRVLSVCGAGGRALPLMVDSVEDLYAVDISPFQLHLCELKKRTIEQLKFQDFKLFWAYAPYDPQAHQIRRKEIFDSLELPSNIKEEYRRRFEDENWNSILYTGKWEKTFGFISKLIQKLIGDHAQKIFSFENIEDQRKYIEKEFPKKRWKLLMSIIGNKAFFNALLYKGDFIQKNVDESYIEYYSKAYNHLFNYQSTRSSFFLQLCFLGKLVFEEGNTVEAQEEVFMDLKERLKNARLHLLEDDLISAIHNTGNLDYISLSDVPSYFDGDLEKNYLQQIRPHLKEEGIAVVRNYLRIPDADLTGYKDITEDYKDLIASETVQMYRFQILQKVTQ